MLLIGDVLKYSFSLQLFIFLNNKYTITCFLLLLKAEQKQNESKSTFALRKGLVHLRSLSLKRVTWRTIGMKSKLSRHWHKIEGLERKRKLDPENLPCLFSNNQWEEQWSYISAVSFELHTLTCLKVYFLACWCFSLCTKLWENKANERKFSKIDQDTIAINATGTILWMCEFNISKEKKMKEPLHKTPQSAPSEATNFNWVILNQ